MTGAAFEMYRNMHGHCDLTWISEPFCQVFDSYVHSPNCALLAIAEMPNDQLTSIHTLSLPPLHL